MRYGRRFLSKDCVVGSSLLRRLLDLSTWVARRSGHGHGGGGFDCAPLLLLLLGRKRFPMDDEVVLHGEAIFTYLHRILRSIVG